MLFPELLEFAENPPRERTVVVFVGNYADPEGNGAAQRRACVVAAGDTPTNIDKEMSPVVYALAYTVGRLVLTPYADRKARQQQQGVKLPEPSHIAPLNTAAGITQRRRTPVAFIS